MISVGPEVGLLSAQKWDDPEKLDALELSMLASGLPVVDLPVTHRWTPGMYSREIFMPATFERAGQIYHTVLTSKIHKTEHQFVVISGRAEVYVPGVGVEVLEAGHVGITKPGTRRVLLIHEDCRWITFHPLEEGEEGDLEAIEARIIERRELPGGGTVYELYQEALVAFQLQAGGAP